MTSPMQGAAAREYLERRPWRELEAPAEVLSVPTMLSPQELALLYALARDYASGDGAIVDAGCFLGGSSAALLAGVRDRPSPWPGPPVASYDLFEVEDYTVEQFFSGEDRRAVGDTFRPLYDRRIGRFPGPHAVHEGDIASFGWDGGPIEVLFLDVLKTWEVNDAVLRDFFPHVVPGRTLLVHQDYGWGEAPWIQITVELMRDSLRWIDALPYATHVFLVERPIPDSVLETRVKDLPADRKLALIDQAIANNIGDGKPMAEISKGVLLGLLGRASEGRRLIDDVTSRNRGGIVEQCGTRTSSMLSGWPDRD
jgi:hypothetical protein